MCKKFMYLGILALLLGLAGSAGGATTLNPTADASSQSGDCDTASLSFSQWNHIFMKFDLSSVQTPVSSATLRLYYESSQALTIYVWTASSDDWTECGTLPTKGSTQMASASATGPGWYEFDVTSYVDAEAAGDDIITFCVTNSHDNWWSICAREGSNPPELLVQSAGPSADADIVETSSAPTIDGSIDSVWSNANSYSVATVIVGTVSSDSDLSGTWRALWNSTNLYYLVEVTDDSLINDSANAWDDDSVELYIDADNSKGTSYDGVDDYQYVFRWNDGTIHLGSNSATNTTGVVFDMVSVSGGYNFEVSIPWSTLGVTPAQGNLIGADVHLNDDDDGGSRDGKKAWFGDDNAWQDPSVFGTAELTGTGGPPPPGQASNPSPADGATGQSIDVDLSWTAGADATSHDVYFGDTTSPPFVQNQSGTTYDPGTLNEVTTYYWRIDEVGAGGTTTGVVWSFTTAAPGVWSNQDVGSPGAAGSASESAGVWTIEGDGSDIWGTSDQFHYVYQPISGDGEIEARVATLENTNNWAKAGVMIRESLTGGSRHAMMVVTPGNGTAFQRRTSTDGSSDHTAGSSVTAPYWVRLVRSGNTFTGYESSDGSSWNQVGSATVSMATDVYIGLPVTSHSGGVLCTATIDNVTVTGGGPPPPPGQATNPSPADGATDVSTTADLSWTAGSGATSHDVYFGTTSPGTFQGNQTATTFDPGTLSEVTTYYWRIDEVGAGGTTTGNVWSFTTEAAGPGPGTGTGLTGDYYDNIDFTGFVLTRTDATVNFDWGSGSPDPAIGADTFSIQWSGQVEPMYSETYTFYTTSDDGVRLWVNGQLIIDNWTDHAPTENSGTIALTAGTKYDIAMDFYENGGGAVAELEWSSASQAREVIPQSQLYEAAPQPPGQATNPNPANGATGVSTGADLSWTAGSGATSHDVYFGQDSTPDSGEFKGNQTGTTFDPGTLANDTTYYWRIDEKNANGTTTGNVWSFTTTGAAPPTGMTVGCNFWRIDWGEGGWNHYFASGVDWSTTTNPWNPTFVSELQESKMTCLRFMDWVITNGSAVTSWSQRIPKTANHYYGGNTVPLLNSDGSSAGNGYGVAYEWQIDLCNRVGADIWVTVPHAANADYQTQLANLLYNNLNSNLKVYVEYSNETWNWGFYQTTYCDEQSTAVGIRNLDVGEYCEPWWKYKVYASVRLWERFEAVFGTNSPRLVKVLGGQVGYHWPDYDYNHQIIADLACLNNSTINPNGITCDAWGAAPYWGSPSNPNLGGISDMMLWAHNSLVGTGIKLICYEGGSDNYSDPAGCVTVQLDPGQEQLYIDALNILEQYCEGVFNQYCFVGDCWGLKKATGDPASEAPKWRGALQWINSRY